MFLTNYISSDYGKEFETLSLKSCNYEFFYNYWKEQLFERIMRLFVWENTYDPVERTGIPPKEIEMRLLLRGHCGIAKYKDELTAFFGSFNGVTKYQDEWTHYTVNCPVYSGRKKIGKDIIVIDNNALRNNAYWLVHHYAVLLGHAETTLINTLVNARDSGGVPIATTEKQKQSIRQYQNQLFMGKYGVVTDIGNLGIEYAGSDKKTAQDIINIMEVREKLIKSFYSDIGVRSAYEKRNNTVTAEVEADTSLLLLNLADMLKHRKNGCEQVNALFGTNWSVHVAEEIDYGAENQRAQFDTATEMHMMEDKIDVTEGEENVSKENNK